MPAGLRVGEIAIFPLPAFEDNYIWLLVWGDRAVVVDPGEEGPVLAALEARKLTLDGILLTHHHGDHGQAEGGHGKKQGGGLAVAQILAESATQIPQAPGGIEA